MKGFSKRNLELIRKWYTFWNNASITKQVVSQLETEDVFKFIEIPWGHNIAIISKCKNLDEAIYHTNLHCYIVIELKTVEFKPEHAGKLNFYIKAVDNKFKKELDNPTIGILLCKSKNKIIAEYALSDIHKPMGISEYQIIHSLPESFKSSLPSVEELEEELSALKVDFKKNKIVTDKDELNLEEKKVVSYIRLNEKITTRELKDLLNISDTKAKAVFKNLIDKNILERKGSGRSTFYVLFNGVCR